MLTEKPARRRLPKPYLVPFRVLVDGREKWPYTFDGLHADSDRSYRPLEVRREWARLETGDYSIAQGIEGPDAESVRPLPVAVERKTLQDLYSTLGQHRERFEAEHERLSKLKFAAVVVEASWDEIVHRPPERSRLSPKSVLRTAISWSSRYRVPWWCVEGRRAAEVVTFRLLEKWFGLLCK